MEEKLTPDNIGSQVQPQNTTPPVAPEQPATPAQPGGVQTVNPNAKPEQPLEPVTPPAPPLKPQPPVEQPPLQNNSAEFDETLPNEVEIPYEEAFKQDPFYQNHWMKDVLAKRPKKEIFIPLMDGENPDSAQYVCINNYPMWVRKNTYIMVPDLVANVLRESMGQTAVVGRNLINAEGKSLRLDQNEKAKDALR